MVRRIINESKDHTANEIISNIQNLVRDAKQSLGSNWAGCYAVYDSKARTYRLGSPYLFVATNEEDYRDKVVKYCNGLPESRFEYYAVYSRDSKGESLTESSWAEIDKQFSRGYQRRLETIWDNNKDMFSKMEQEIKEEAPSVIGIYTDIYSMKSPAYSDFTKEDLSKDRQTMYHIIEKYYDLCTEELDESLTEEYKVGDTYDIYCTDCDQVTRQTYKGKTNSGDEDMYVCTECGCENYEKVNSYD